MLELELKARVDDPAALRDRIRHAGGRLQFVGRLSDRRYDDGQGRITALDRVVRVRRWIPDDSEPYEVLGWKGPTRQVAGYKAREEWEARVVPGDSVTEILTALDLHVAEQIDRRVELWQVGGATVRIEWYPAMDTLVEVEGEAQAIEAAVAVSGIPRTEYSSDPLPTFVAAYQHRTGRAARLHLGESDAVPDHWPTR